MKIYPSCLIRSQDEAKCTTSSIFFSSSEKWDSDVLGAARLGSAQLISLSTETIYLHFVPPLPSAPVEIKRQFE
jgi:hypothetical protein